LKTQFRWIVFKLWW